MNKPFTLLLLCLSYFGMAQPVNDDCNGLIDLGTVPVCVSTDIYTNVDATASDIGTDNVPNCFANATERDVWFSFTAPDTLLDYNISVIGCPDPGSGDPSIINPQLALYRGDVCAVDQLLLMGCASADDGESEVTFQPLFITPGIQYFIRVNDWSSGGSPNWGAFKLCIESIQKAYTIDQGGSTSCYGEIFDTGGPNGDYGPNENHVFTICPDEPHGCINFWLDSYNIQGDNFIEKLVMYDGPDIFSPQIGTVPFIDFTAVTFYPSTGGTCYSVKASSGCLTLRFLSDGAEEYEGFHGFWECTDDPCDIPEQISVQHSVADQTVIDNISTPQTTTTIDKINCQPTQYGTFQATDDSDLGLEKGLLLTTGFVTNAIGPNILNDVTVAWGTGGDPDLDVLSFPYVTYDACVVELDVFVSGDELSFEYIFASDEYPEFINQAFNDVFAFLISGPGITGDPNLGNQENIAIIPGTNSEVSINNVNPTNNWEYYRYNGVLGDFSPQLGNSIEYDGFTSDYLGKKKSLTARRNVEPCNTYHLKLVVADVGDNFFDSGVFISEVSGGQPSMAVTFYNGLDYLVEECTVVPDEVTLSLPAADFTEETTFDIQIGGTATRDVDYTLDIPSTVTFLPGETDLVFPIVTLADGTEEGPETIEIKMVNDFGCGEIVYATLLFEIQDNPTIEITPDIDSLYLCTGNNIQLDVSGANLYTWSPQDIFNNSLIQNPVATPTASTYLVVNGNVGNCNFADSIWVEVVDPQLDIEVVGSPDICEGEEVDLIANNNAGNTNLSWTNANTLSSGTAVQVTASPTTNTTYIASVSLQNCSAADTITVTVEPFDFPQLTTTDTIICQDNGFILAEDITSTNTTYTWSPDIGLDPGPNVSGPFAMPQTNTVYTLNAVGNNGLCSNMATVNVEVINFDPSLEVSEPTATICSGDEIELSASTGTFAPNFYWLLNGDTIAQGATFVASPDVNTTYQVIATDMDNHCFYDETIVDITVIPSFEIDEIIVLDESGTPLGSSPNLVAGQIISLEVNTTPVLTTDASYEWAIEGESPFLTTTTNSTGPITVQPVVSSTTLTYQVFITDENGCLKEAFVSTNISSVPVEVPSGFTPDGDGVNDVFRLVTPLQPTILQFKIYNRWGQVVHNGGESWDGMYKGEPAPSDVYIYHIIYQFSSGDETAELKGDLTLIR